MVGKSRYCEICGVREINRGGFFACFPKNEQRCKTWVKLVGKKDLLNVPIEKLHELRHVCGDHFEPRDFGKTRGKLKKRAFPKLQLFAPPLSDSLLRGFPQHVASQQQESDKTSENIFSWQTAELIEADASEDPAPAPVPEKEKLPDDVVTLSLFCDDDRPIQSESIDLVPSIDLEDVELRCKDCAAGIDGYSFWCVQCACGALCGACAGSAAHDRHYALRAPRRATQNQTQAVLAVIRQQLLMENLLTLYETDENGVKTEVKEETQEPASPTAPASTPDPLAVKPHTDPLIVEPYRDPLTAEPDKCVDDESNGDHHPYKRPRLMDDSRMGAKPTSTVSKKEGDVSQQLLLNVHIRRGSQTVQIFTPSDLRSQDIIRTTTCNRKGSQDALATNINLRRTQQSLLKVPSNVLRGSQTVQARATRDLRSQNIQVTSSNLRESQIVVTPEKVQNIHKPVQHDYSKGSNLQPAPQNVLKSFSTPFKETSEQNRTETGMNNLDDVVDEELVEFLEEEILDDSGEDQLDTENWDEQIINDDSSSDVEREVNSGLGKERRNVKDLTDKANWNEDDEISVSNRESESQGNIQITSSKFREIHDVLMATTTSNLRGSQNDILANNDVKRTQTVTQIDLSDLKDSKTKVIVDNNDLGQLRTVLQIDPSDSRLQTVQQAISGIRGSQDATQVTPSDLKRSQDILQIPSRLKRSQTRCHFQRSKSIAYSSNPSNPTGSQVCPKGIPSHLRESKHARDLLRIRQNFLPSDPGGLKTRQKFRPSILKKVISDLSESQNVTQVQQVISDIRGSQDASQVTPSNLRGSQAILQIPSHLKRSQTRCSFQRSKSIAKSFNSSDPTGSQVCPKVIPSHLTKSKNRRSLLRRQLQQLQQKFQPTDPRRSNTHQKFQPSILRKSNILLTPKKVQNITKAVQHDYPKGPKPQQVSQNVLRGFSTPLKVTSEPNRTETGMNNLDDVVDEELVEFLEEEIFDDSEEDQLDNRDEHRIDENSVRDIEREVNIALREERINEKDQTDTGDSDEDDENSVSDESEVVDKECNSQVEKENRIDENSIRDVESEVDDSDLDKDYRIEEDVIDEDSINETDEEDIAEGVGRRTRNVTNRTMTDEQMLRKLTSEATVQLQPLTSSDIRNWVHRKRRRKN
ncbi:uncharacterized protein LOC133530491 isoform X2 [Cydia pomonella]|uniref:uncharacterized protein LOC133530491 isoform X2 n=1 Tax=Cydia pomonella TaxID=82600 RepID=UPI002ADDE64C|nr:uncharacterized protein LOC133530491 isoform X2 [Cydia pomonella]